MATEGPGPAPALSLTAVPRFEDIPRAGDGLDAESVRAAFDAFRRHAAQLQAQLRVLQVAGTRSGSGAAVEGTGHAVRMDALHLIRAAAEFADTIERDAQAASATQVARTQEVVSGRMQDAQEREAEVERYRQESERQRAEMLNGARNEAREVLAKAHADATRELQEAEAKGDRLLEQARHQATELTNSVRAEVEQTLEWARAQAASVLGRAQHAAEQLLSAAGLGDEAIAEVASAIVQAAQQVAKPAPEMPPAAALAGAVSPERPAPPSAEPVAAADPADGPPVADPVDETEPGEDAGEPPAPVS